MPTLTLRISSAEMREVRRRARQAGKNVSEFVRSSILPEKEAPVGRARIVRDKATGSLVLHSPARTPPLTPEAVRDILADWP